MHSKWKARGEIRRETKIMDAAEGERYMTFE
jgi:hypothetical protein